MNVQGRIDYINSRDTKVGTTYDIKVNGKNYGLFKNKCPFPEGTVVKFEAKENGDFLNVVKGSMEKVEDAPQEEKQSQSSSGGGSSYDRRQKSIEFQSSRKLASEVLASLIQADAIAMPTKDKGARYDAIMGLLDDLTWKFFDEVDSLEEHQERRAYEAAQLQEGGEQE